LSFPSRYRARAIAEAEEYIDSWQDEFPSLSIVIIGSGSGSASNTGSGSGIGVGDDSGETVATVAQIEITGEEQSWFC
jgi:hypothetical protein